MSGDKVLRLELESKKRCDDVNFMKKFVGNIVNDAKIAESIEKISYSCCSSSCCNYNATSGATTDVGAIKSTTKMSENVKIMTKSSESTAITRSTSPGEDNCYDTATDPLECLV